MTAGSPWFRATNQPDGEQESVPPQAEAIPGYEQPGYEQPGYEETAAYPYQQEYAYEPIPEPGLSEAVPVPESPYEASEPYEAPYEAPYEPRDETMALRSVEPSGTAETPVAPLAGPGRAERRRAAKGKGRGGRRGGPPSAADADASGSSVTAAAPMSRVEARRAARAAKDSVGVVASRVVGELFITFGVVMLLFVAYQVWWTNVRADQQANQAKGQIEDAWSKGRAPGAFEPGEGFAIMYIPKLDVVVPVAEGISKPKVLDRGMVGHYSEGSLKTAMPGDKQGNFAVAGHRNTHGEPFRYINQLTPGDPIVVETQDAYYTYEMASILPQTAPSNVSVIDPVPKQSGFKEPGRYITLTTCTPEFTSTYRMIVWGKMVEERPRSKGKPDALVG
ncbi:class E sortase [Streptomyces sp. P9(2023)]|uniref:class E sortase n=1 Tax=Streptomyces sp. P9(2023) TaxID=3064394 RepID=UPI0028F43922|nr:class E sortase [Streptomyces sp. P9(2023)]MDT9690837.1 class E sortase [Streptomyces sp. P9(2023)]